jgi:Rod binding domain-containing protein
MNIEALKPRVNAADIAPEQLAKNTHLTDQQKIAEASRQFECILLKQILESSQKTVIHSKFSDDSTSSSIYHDMITTQLADGISKSGAFGFSKSFEQQLERPEASAPRLLDLKASTLNAAEHHTTTHHTNLSHDKTTSAHPHAAARSLKPLP